MTQFEIQNRSGMRVTFLEVGGIITAIEVPDRQGKHENVVLAYGSLAEYNADTAYLGAIVGRYANRIARARFAIDNTEYQLRANDGPNHLHGGPDGFHRMRWEVHVENPSTAVLTHVSPDGDEGYPGELSTSVRYTLTDVSGLLIEYEATTTRATHVNLTQHSYFNLGGPGSRDILNHELTVNASAFTPVSVDLIPTGELRAVRDTPFDFTRPAAIGARIESPDEQLTIGDGYDHNFVLDGTDEMLHAVTLRDPASRRVMEIHTTEPGIQVYSGNKLSSALPAAMGNGHRRRGGIALETQHFPDSPNQPRFPSTLLRPGETYRSATLYPFGAD